DQAWLEASVDRERSAGPDLHHVGGNGEEINLGSHWTIPFVGSDDMTSRGPSIVTPRRKNFASLRFIPPGMACWHVRASIWPISISQHRRPAHPADRIDSLFHGPPGGRPPGSKARS